MSNDKLQSCLSACPVATPQLMAPASILEAGSPESSSRLYSGIRLIPACGVALPCPQPAEPVRRNGAEKEKPPQTYRNVPFAEIGHCLQRALSARHAGHPWVGFDRHPERAGSRFEDCLADVVAVAAIVHQNVQIAEGVGGKGLPEILDQLAVEVANLGAGKFGLIDQEGAAREADRRPGERAFHCTR